ncbi:MAG: 4Fe-4S dicluster domain-containing protein [Armatimonadetes bacterium]|nr:4Fe-4S dicluster domain-containing protein [Armatimonadota bacterium]
MNMKPFFIIHRNSLDSLFGALVGRNFTLVGPTLRDRAVAYSEIATVNDLPFGWTDEQDGGTYRLKKSDRQTLFDYAAGPHSWKKFLFPPALQLWEAERQIGPHEASPEYPPSHEGRGEQPRYAMIGVRSCDLHAIAVQDKVFAEGSHRDPTYEARRKNLFIVAVNCSHGGGTCFCRSMNTGPRATSGFDLALTEILEADRHVFLAESGSDRGAQVLREVTQEEAQESDIRAAERITADASVPMGRLMDTTDIRGLLYNNYDHPRWDHAAARCLACGNCTIVCPTCFCNTVEDFTDLAGTRAERRRRWDVCFAVDFSYIHGGSVRSTIRSRYRQWLTHKVATWIDQFGTSGCVGCGRCITWCPVGIDITEEVREIRANRPDDRKTLSEVGHAHT